MEVNDLHSFLHFVQFPELDALRKVRDSNPRYDVMRTPHFECGSFDHSDNFPIRREQICLHQFPKASAKVLLFFELRKLFRVFFRFRPTFWIDMQYKEYAEPN